MSKGLNLFIFHNDLRLTDNTALNEALSTGKTIPVFIFTPEQVGKQNQYRSQPAIDFMCAALNKLDSDLRKHHSRLHVFYGRTDTIVKKLIKQCNIIRVYSNANYTPFSIERDKQVDKICQSLGVEFNLLEDYGLFPIGSITTGGNVYKKFTPYYLATQHVKIPACKTGSFANFAVVAHSLIKINSFAVNKMKLNIKFPHYDAEQHNYPSIDTTRLSPYIKFGVVSIRQVYHHYHATDDRSGHYDHRNGHHDHLIRQLIWRDFYMNLVWANPRLINGNNSTRNFKQKHIKWIELNSTNKKYFLAWCKGETGYPIVDAAMRQLNTIGWMHNRGRLIVAWFLTKVMGWHWKYGERYFAIKLIDYDPAQNNGNWQFCAGCGVDTDQYFRQFNPWLQSEKYDPEAKYIKKWIPELAKVPPKDLHNWYKTYQNYKIRYPPPMIDYEKQKNVIKKLYNL